jgi:CRP-like cAMP-binding protein
MDALVRPLLNVPLFQGLKPLQLSEIARRADRIVYKPGDVIVTAHAGSDAAVLVVSGEAVRTEGPGMMEKEEAVPQGALISELMMLIETESTSTVVARTAVKALRITRSEMLALMAEDPSLADHFIDKISGRLSTFVDGLREIDRALAGPQGIGASDLPLKAAAQAAVAATLH